MSLPLEPGYFRYHLVQCADETRDERLNVGVLVIDPGSGQATCRTAATLERIEQNLPEVPMEHLKLVLQVMGDSAAQGYTPEGMADLDRQIEQQDVQLLRRPLQRPSYSPSVATGDRLLQKSSSSGGRRHGDPPGNLNMGNVVPGASPQTEGQSRFRNASRVPPFEIRR